MSLLLDALNRAGKDKAASANLDQAKVNNDWPAIGLMPQVPEPEVAVAPSLPTPAPVPEPPSSKSYDQNAVRELAMQIVRDDSTARPRIMEILGQYGAKTTNQLKPEDCHEVHGKLLALAFDIAKNGELV